MDACDYIDDGCPRCRCCGTEWVECEQCSGEGETEPGALYEEDPLWYDEDDVEPCRQCNGAGGWRVCGGDCDDQGKHAPRAAAGSRP